MYGKNKSRRTRAKRMKQTSVAEAIDRKVAEQAVNGPGKPVQKAETKNNKNKSNIKIENDMKKTKKAAAKVAEEVVKEVAETRSQETVNDRDTAAAEAGTEEAQQEEKTSVELAPFKSVTRELDIELIDPSPYNPRTKFKEESIDDLAASIREKGLLSEIITRRKDDRFEIVCGERRFRAVQKCGLKTIAAKIMEMTDREAEELAITENIQRENLNPIDEAQAIRKMMKTYRCNIAKLCKTFGKTRKYIEARLSLLNLIPEVSEMLENEEIKLEIAVEFSKYSHQAQKEVYTNYFRQGAVPSWKGIAVKEFAKKMYERYMTKLRAYNFDKSKCAVCSQNTLRQELFKDLDFAVDAGCLNTACLRKKNVDYLVKRCTDALAEDPHLTLAVSYVNDTDAAVLNRLHGMGIEVAITSRHRSGYDLEEEKPVAPSEDDYEDKDEFADAMQEYTNDMEEYDHWRLDYRLGIAEGRYRRYAFILERDIEFRYEEIEQEPETTEETAGTETAPQPQKEPEKTVEKIDPTEELTNKGERLRKEYHTKIAAELIHLVTTNGKRLPKTEITPGEEALFYFSVVRTLRNDWLIGLGIEYPSDYGRLLEQMNTLTAEQKRVIQRMSVAQFCSYLNPNFIEPGSVNYKIIDVFTGMNYPEESREIKERLTASYETQFSKLQKEINRITAEHALLEAPAESEAGVIEDAVIIGEIQNATPQPVALLPEAGLAQIAEQARETMQRIEAEQNSPLNLPAADAGDGAAATALIPERAESAAEQPKPDYEQPEPEPVIPTGEPEEEPPFDDPGTEPLLPGEDGLRIDLSKENETQKAA